MEPFTVRPYQSGDEEKITALFKDVFGKELTVSQWTWKYAVPGRGKIFSKIAEDASSAIIGYAGAIPLRGKYQNRPLQFFQIADVMVHPKARGFLGRRNVFEVMTKELFEGIGKEFPAVFCYGFPGHRPFLLGKRIGVYEKIEIAADCVMRSKLSFLNPYSIEMLPWDDRRLDSLWACLSDSLPLSLARDREYLAWRYASNPFNSYRLFGVFRSAELRGWFVVRERAEEILVIDSLLEEKLLQGALKALGKHLSRWKRKIIRLWLPEHLRKGLRNCRVEKTDVVVTNMIWKLPLHTETVREDLYYTMGDVDIF